MDKQIIRNERLGEEYSVIKHKSGLTICLYPMPKFTTAMAMFGTRYGSIDTTFKTKYEDDYITVPEGIAHYLEHKLFENDDCDTFEKFSKTGASANAYTTFDSTAYYFACTENFEENLRILLDFVQNPYFTDENVEKEQGIIAQEIKSYLDDPGWVVFFDNLQAVYHNNPVKINIAGTTESIKEINKELLYRCYNTFYNLNNMVLTIAGNFDPEMALGICDELLKTSEDIALDVIIPDEPYEVREKRTAQKLYCALPLFQLSFKLPNYTGYKALEKNTVYNLVFETILGSFSDFYSRMYESGMINETFHVGVFSGRGYCLPMVDGESPDPDKLADEIKKELKNAIENGFSREDFDTVKKMTYGELLGQLTVGGCAKAPLNAHLNSVNMFDSYDITARTTYEDALKALKELDIENSSLSIIEPIQKG